MPKTLTTNLLTYNGYNDVTNLDRILSVPKKLKYEITQCQSQYDTSGEVRPGDIITSGITTGSHIMQDMIPKLPSGYEGWYLCDSLEEHTDSQTGGLWMDVGYCYSTIPAGFEGYKSFQNFNSITGQISSIMESLGYDYNHGYSIYIPAEGGLYNGDIVLALCTMMSTQGWTPIGITGVFIVTPGPNDTFTITDYFITDMTNSCEYQTSNYGWLDTFRYMNTFENNRQNISSSCGVTYDDFVMHLYTNKI